MSFLIEKNLWIVAVHWKKQLNLHEEKKEALV